MKNNNARKRIGIIGAGASGLASAWLLDEDHEIILFEKEDRLGGHVCTIPIEKNGKTIPVEAGVEFFSNMMFGQFTKLLQILNVPTRQYPLTYTYYNTHDDQKVIFPPIHDGAIAWKSFKPHTIFDLTQFHHFVNAGKNILAVEDTGITLSDYADTLMLTQEFKNHFLYPFFAASWGVSPEDMKQFAAYDILKWGFVNEPAGVSAILWEEVVGGLSTYINALAHQLKHATIIREAEVTDIACHDNHYTITAQSKKYDVDHIILATNAMIAKNLLKNIDCAQSIAHVLGSIEYFYTTIAIHGDRRFMPTNESDWSTVNIRYDGINSALTICKPWMKEAEIFRSWITYPVGVPMQNAMPNPLYDLRHFYHPKITHDYFIAQKEIAHLQGTNNLWIAGFYTHDVDSHNSAIISAINIAKKLAPHSHRLSNLSAR
jgi:uncharacterized protein